MSHGQIAHLLIAARELLAAQDISPEDRTVHKTAKLRLDQALYLVRTMHHRRNVGMRFPNGIPRQQVSPDTGGNDGNEEDSADSKDH